ncbi:allantoate deiminase [Methylobacterium sp. UNC300MFChir4.1]|uniref:hydantoinase/carbamoylase family amidase n=1 Tax=Methylobacterium sp. UNC300MFChir4.1 TaxID=1502747 RepID=UPI0008B0B621|nr:hydantoinase/carbamoylase family amidase [Methylobacterium sp. UNC300MFChir4.1]SEN96137.1 allantoate deiminase [Methylobacterium sp. UNC300MFChir4.1]
MTAAPESAAGIVLTRVDRLAGISAYPWTLTRRVFSPQQAEAEALVLGWMAEAGLSARRDPAGNLVGRIEGAVPGGPAVVVGGHVDTREDAGRYDGTLGVLIGIAAVERLIRHGPPPRHAVEVVAFVADAAGRFGPRQLGSRAVVGRLAPDALDWDDAYGVTLRRALEAHGLDPARLASARRASDAILAYLEVAAEAGPVLERSGAPVGIVPALSESTMLRVTLTGAAVDAAANPMPGRRDALAGAAECVLAAERVGLAREGVTVTVMRLDVAPVPTFVVAGSATLGVRLDSADDGARRAAVAELAAALEAVAARRRLGIAVERSVDPDATRCDPGLVRLFEEAVAAAGHRAVRLAQGVTTDASHMALLGPIGLALIRCRGGVGWGAAGTVDPADVAVGLDVLAGVVGALAGGAPSPREPRDGHLSPSWPAG